MVAVDARAPRDGRVIEELGHYDPMLPETDARAQLKGERIDYWLSVGAQPTDKSAVLIKKYGTTGTHLKAQEEALARLGQRKQYTPAEPAPAAKPVVAEPVAEAAAEGSSEAAAEG
jgi:small subunit ribosomal protein S16